MSNSKMNSDSADSTEKTIYFSPTHHYLEWSGRMILVYVVLGILGPLMLAGGIRLLRLRQPHAVHVLVIGLGVTIAVVVGVVAEFLRS
jgi:hypothetical protein